MSKLLRIIGTFLLLALITGFVYERVAQRRASNRFRPPGELVSLGERDLHVNCVGDGTPTVVVQSGSGSWTVDWLAAQELLSQHYRVCTYDRAGYGWSDASSDTGDFRSINRDLHRALDQVGVEAPFVLLGHSFGGLYARSYAIEYPEEVSGLILLDSRHEDANERLPAEIVSQEKQMRPTYLLARGLAHVGLVRLLAPYVLPESNLPAAQARAFWAQATEPSFFRTVTAEIAGLPQLAEHVRSETFDVPVVVVAQGLGNMFSGHAQAAEASSAWRRMQEDLLELSERSTLLVAEESGHNIHLQQPAILLDAVEVMTELQGG